MFEPETQSKPDCAPNKSHQTSDEVIAEETQDTACSSSSERADEPNRETESLVTSHKKATLCHFFKKTGSCRNGDECKFAHESPAKDGEEAKSEHVSSGAKGVQQEICRFYSRSGWCRNGKRCRFLHDKLKATSSKDAVIRVTQSSAAVNSQEVATDTPKDAAVQEEEAKSKSDAAIGKSDKPKKMCRFFKAGRCRSGSRCKFSHSVAGGADLATGAQAKPLKSAEPRSATRRPIVIQDERVSMKITDVGEEDLDSFKKTEVTQLMKRFTKDSVTVMEKEDSETMYRVIINPTDPDWPFDIRDFEFEVMFPVRYPLDPFTISMPEDQVLPNTVLQYMSANITEWVLARHGTNQISGKVELMFRPFLRWLDRSLETMFTYAAKKFKMEVDAKAAGIELIPYAKQKPAEMRDIHRYTDTQHPAQSEGEVLTGRTAAPPPPDKAADAPSAGSITAQTPSGEITTEAGRRDDQPSADTESPSEETKKAIDLSNVQRRGTEIKLFELQLSESISTLVAKRIGVTIQCTRCKTHCDVVTPPRRLNSARCGKCQHQQLVTFRQSLIHHFTATLGFLDLEGCTTFDLILPECVFALGCLSCSEETQVEGLQFGQIRTLWCEKCHTKMTLQLQAAKFHQLQVQASIAQGSDQAHVIQVKQIKKQVHPDIHEGSPLPHNGTCKHYKKSFRWLRFPCCGKCYPCDECHDENEPDHEMKYATRMICGFCCKEQQYTLDKPCISCGSLTTKARTSHWEGGAGCRNKTKMSKSDKQKYSNTSKTTSRKQQSKEADQKAK